MGSPDSRPKIFRKHKMHARQHELKVKRQNMNPHGSPCLRSPTPSNFNVVQIAVIGLAKFFPFKRPPFRGLTSSVRSQHWTWGVWGVGGECRCRRLTLVKKSLRNIFRQQSLDHSSNVLSGVTHVKSTSVTHSGTFGPLTTHQMCYPRWPHVKSTSVAHSGTFGHIRNTHPHMHTTSDQANWVSPAFEVGDKL